MVTQALDVESSRSAVPRAAVSSVNATMPVVPAAVDDPGKRASVSTLIKDALGGTADLLQAQVQLAVLEIRQDAKTAVRIGALLAVGGAFAFLALGLGFTGAALGLAQLLPVWAAFVVLSIALGIIAAVLLARGRQCLIRHQFAEMSATAAEEGSEWIREQLS